jgi:signal transduction histidine kinase
MRLTKKLEKEVLEVYNTYWNAYLKGDMKTFFSFLDDNIKMIGTTEHEVFFNKKEVTAYFGATADQVTGQLEMRNRNIKIEPNEELISVTEQLDMFVLIDHEWVFYGKVRLSSLLHKTEDGWKLMLQHGSFPDTRAQEGEQFSLEKISAENLQLREAVKRRTVELEHKTRELETEASLERVRAQALAMHKPDDLPGICEVLFETLQNLGFAELRNTMINIFDDEKGSFLNYDYSAYAGKTITNLFYNTHPVIEKQVQQARSSADAFSEAVFTGQDLADWKAFRKKAGETDDPKVDSIPSLFYYFYSIDTGVIGISTYSAVTEEKKNILKRFRNVFDFAYRRYMDVAQAETQAREAQIELALERVRARTMAMQKSEELGEASLILFQQLKELGEPAEQLSIGIINEAENIVEVTVTLHGDILQKVFRHSIDEPILMNKIYKSWKAQEKILIVEIKGKDLQIYNQYRDELVKTDIFSKNQHPGDRRVVHSAFFSKGMLALATNDQRPAASLQLLERFAKVFDLTYTRFTDLKQAEAQAREAKIEAALERVRSRTLAMQKSDELAETAAVLFRQLIYLGIAPNRLYIGIIKDDNGTIEFWVTDEDGGKVSNQFTGDSNRNSSMKKMYAAWKREEKSLTIDMQGEELQNYFHYLADELNIPFKQGLEQKRRIQSIAFFGKGFIGIASPDDQPNATISLLERFAAVFNLTYTRFNDLKVAEAHAIQAEEDLVKLQTEKKRAEEALAELQVTQKQLIQSEKMASLGELTAGIAHEIQNPLNFVNNFSEVSNELLDEMLEEVTNKNYDEVKQMVADIKQNLEKINHHGKRADAIVKGMLQHSRSSNGQKELSDINILADEYLKLAYHGLRAKDKSFNTLLKTSYDETIGKINIIPQDIGRVLLNLITNAFYTVTEKKASGIENYEPTVSVTTKKNNGTFEIKVTDNGNGIPQKLLDKIFQPFFTTKPTGQGTGLGLSLAYDIVKAHNGELIVKTQEGQGTDFIIQLPIK